MDTDRVTDLGDFQRHNNMILGFPHDPVTLRVVQGAGSFLSLRQRGIPWGLEVTIRKAPAFPQTLNDCVVAQKITQVIQILRLDYERNIKNYLTLYHVSCTAHAR